MADGTTRRRTTGWWLAGALLLLVALPATARAHTELRSTAPADGARLAEVPREIRLRFSARVELALTTVRVIGPDGRPLAVAAPYQPGDSSAVVAVEIRDLPLPGAYTVHWRTAAADGHPLNGHFTFIVEPDAVGLPAGEPLGAARVPAEHHPAERPERARVADPGGGFDAGSPLYVAIRWLTFTALLALIGAATFRLLVLGRLRRRWSERELVKEAAAGAARLAAAAAGGLAVAVVARLAAQSYAVHGAGSAFDPGRVAAMLVRTTWGWGWLVQAGAVLGVLLGLAWRRRGHPAGWVIALVGSALLAFTPALSGHAVAVETGTSLAVIADGLHVLGAGGWLGTLLAVAVVGLPAALRLPDRPGAAVAALVNAFSPVALAFAALVVATGTVSATLQLGSPSALWTTPYGRTLLVKLGLLLPLFATAANNWRRVRPALGTPASAARLRRSVVVELSVGVAVLLATAVLVATPPS